MSGVNFTGLTHLNLREKWLTEDIIRSCLPCQAATRQKLKPKKPLQMTELPERPWQKISLDFRGPYPSGEYCLIVVDDYSRYPVVELVSTTSAAAVILRLDKTFFFVWNTRRMQIRQWSTLPKQRVCRVCKNARI